MTLSISSQSSNFHRFLKQSILRVSLCTLVLIPVFLAIFPFVSPATAFAGTTLLTTYYPSPNGYYGKMTLVPNSTQSGQCSTGAMYVDNTTGELKYCVDGNTNNPSPDPHTGLPALSPPFTSTANTGTWGNMIAKTPVTGDPPNAVATKAYVDAAAGGGKCYTAYSIFMQPGGSSCTYWNLFTMSFQSGQPCCVTGFTWIADLGRWNVCSTTGTNYSFFPPGAQNSIANCAAEGEAFLCCK